MLRTIATFVIVAVAVLTVQTLTAMIDHRFKEKTKDVLDRENLHSAITAKEEEQQIELLKQRFIEEVRGHAGDAAAWCGVARRG